MHSGRIRRKPKLIRTRACDRNTINDIDLPLLADPSAIIYVGSQLLYRVNNSGTVSRNAVVLVGNAMLIRASAINDSNMELLTDTIRRQGKTWELTTIDGESFFKVI